MQQLLKRKNAELLFFHFRLSLATSYISRVKGFLPEYGQVGILSITDKQFGSMELFSQSKQKEIKDAYIQLELF